MRNGQIYSNGDFHYVLTESSHFNELRDVHTLDVQDRVPVDSKDGEKFLKDNGYELVGKLELVTWRRK